MDIPNAHREDKTRQQKQRTQISAEMKIVCLKHVSN